MKEFAVAQVVCIETPHTLTDTSTGKVFPLVSLEVGLIHHSGRSESLRLHFPPTLLEEILPKLQEVTRQALLLSTGPGESAAH